MAGINIELPIFTAEDLADQKGRQRIAGYLYRLAEQVKYLSANIDGDNVTDAFREEMANTAASQVQDDISGTLTQYETKIEQNARAISAKAEKSEVNALGEAVESVSGELTQTASSLSARITRAQNIADGAEEMVSSLELTLDGVVASIDNNRLVFSAQGLSIKNAAGETVFAQDNFTGNLTITGTINANGGTIGGFTIGEDSITGPNGVELYSSGDSSMVNNILLRSGTDDLGNRYTLISPSNENGYSELRLGMFSYLSQDGLKLYAAEGQLRVEVSYYLYATGGVYFLNLPVISGVQPNLYVDASGQVYRIV